MAKQINIVLVEDDFYSRHLMEMLLRRDWRTRILKQVGNPVDLCAALADLDEHNEKVHLILIDTDIPQNETWLPEALKKLSDYNTSQEEEFKSSKYKYIPPVILFTGVNPNPHIMNLANHPGFAGYILKEEVRYSLAWAATLAVEGHTVITPGVQKFFGNFKRGTLIIDGRNPVANFSERDTEAARLAFMFSMERRDLADELRISEDYSYGLVSSLYNKMGLNIVLGREVEPEEYFGNHPAVMGHLHQIFQALEKLEARKGATKKSKSKKTIDKETLAFHLLTMPDIDTIF